MLTLCFLSDYAVLFILCTAIFLRRKNKLQEINKYIRLKSWCGFCCGILVYAHFLIRGSASFASTLHHHQFFSEPPQLTKEIFTLHGISAQTCFHRCLHTKAIFIPSNSTLIEGVYNVSRAPLAFYLCGPGSNLISDLELCIRIRFTVPSWLRVFSYFCIFLPHLKLQYLPCVFRPMGKTLLGTFDGLLDLLPERYITIINSLWKV